MPTSIPHNDSDIALRAVKLVLERYGPLLHRERNHAIYCLSQRGAQALDHEAFHYGIDYSEDPLIAIDFIRERRKLGVAVARLIFWARHDDFDQAVESSRHAMTEAVSELLTRRIVPFDNFAPKHEALLDRLDEAITESAITFDDLLALFFRGDKAALVAPVLISDELEVNSVEEG